MDEYELLDDFSEGLKSQMQIKKISQRELARKSRMSVSTINRFLNGERIPNVSSVINLMLALDCDFEDLFTVYDFIEK